MAPSLVPVDRAGLPRAERAGAAVRHGRVYLWTVDPSHPLGGRVTAMVVPLMLNEPAVTCALPGAPAWCATWDPSPGVTDSGQGFLAGGGLLQTNVPPADQAQARAKTSSLIPDRISPKIFTWTLGVQHQLLRDSSIEVRYVGTRSVELPAQMRLNSASAFDPRFTSLGGGLTPLPTYLNPADVPATVAAPASTAANFDSFNPQPFSVDGLSPDGKSAAGARPGKPPWPALRRSAARTAMSCP